MNAIHPVLINGFWRPSILPSGTFQAEDPAAGKPYGGEYPVSGEEDVQAVLLAAAEATEELRTTDPAHLADFLEAYAREIEAGAQALAEVAARETGLQLSERFRESELPRTVDQLRQAAFHARDRSWKRATIDARRNLRSQLEPLGGPVVIFGPNNFPFAYNSVSGGDFASAIATGHPVIAKGHPGYPNTTRLLAEAAVRALQSVNLPSGTVQLLYDVPPDLGLRLVSHPLVGAIAFTGSRGAGLAIKAAADKAGKPAYLEMSSINPVFLLEGALAERTPEIREQLFYSCLNEAGQFCTKPGLVVLPAGAAGEDFARGLVEMFRRAKPSPLLSSKGPENLARTVAALSSAGAELLAGGALASGPGHAFANTLLSVSGTRFLTDPAAFQQEAFGNASLLVYAESVSQMLQIAATLEGNLTGSIYSGLGGEDDAAYALLEPILKQRVGRILNDKMPTGLAVSPAMNHGGPFPATGHPGFTAVGFPAALLRFTALRCYDNVRPARLPPELQDKNPTGSMWRFIEGQWTSADAGMM